MKYSRKNQIYRRRKTKRKRRHKKTLKRVQSGGFIGTIFNMAMLPVKYIAKPVLSKVGGRVMSFMNKNNETNGNNLNNNGNNLNNNGNNLNNNGTNLNNNGTNLNNNGTNLNNNGNNLNNNNGNNLNNNVNDIIKDHELKRYIDDNNININTLKKIIKYGDIETLTKIINELQTYKV